MEMETETDSKCVTYHVDKLILSDECICCKNKHIVVSFYYNDNSNLILNKDGFGLSCSKVNMFDENYHTYIEAFIFTSYNPKCNECMKRIESNSLFTLATTTCVNEKTIREQVKKVSLLDVKINTSSYLELCRKGVHEKIGKILTPNMLMKFGSPSIPHYKDKLNLDFLSCNKLELNECFYCKQKLFAYESFYHESGFKESNICGGCPMKLYECYLVYKGKEQELIVSGFGLYDEKCNNCLYRMREVKGIPL